jgi:hypothetical protein
MTFLTRPVGTLLSSFFLLGPLACSGGSTSPADAGPVNEPDAHPAVVVSMNANDPSGSGTNPNETYLNVNNVNPDHFGKLFSFAVDGDQYAQPLYAGNVAQKDGSKKNVVFVATSHDSVYAFDADAASGTPLWKVSVGTPSPIPNPYVANNLSSVAACQGTTFFIRELGVTATPYLDVASGTLYVLALDVDSSTLIKDWTCIHADPTQGNYCQQYACSAPTFQYRLHALDITTGAEKTGSPVTVEGSMAGSGSESQGGQVPFDSMRSFERTSLLEAYGNIYFAFAGYSDNPPYHGWIFAYDAKTLKKAGQFCDTLDGDQAGIWQSGRSLLSDGKGSVYAVTGNGTFDINHSGHDYADSILKLKSDLSDVSDYFSPFLSAYQGNAQYNFLSNWDDDLGSAGATMIPGTTLLLASGKLGNGYLVDTGNLGKWNPSSDKIVQKIRMAWKTNKTSCTDGVSEAFVYGTPVIWSGADGTHLYVWASNDYLRDYLLDSNGQFSTQGVCFCATDWEVAGPAGQVDIQVPDPPCGAPESESSGASIYGGGALSTSSNGKEAGSGIVWATHSTGGNPNGAPSPGALEAYDATQVGTPLWSSDTNATRDGLGNWAKFTPPTIANGKVYAPTFSGQLVVYGLLSKKP